MSRNLRRIAGARCLPGFHSQFISIHALQIPTMSIHVHPRESSVDCWIATVATGHNPESRDKQSAASHLRLPVTPCALISQIWAPHIFKRNQTRLVHFGSCTQLLSFLFADRCLCSGPDCRDAAVDRLTLKTHNSEISNRLHLSS